MTTDCHGLATSCQRAWPAFGVQYALAGIEHYWIVRLKPDDSAIASIEQWRLGPDYRGASTKVTTWTNGESAEAIKTEVPFPIQAAWADLEF